MATTQEQRLAIYPIVQDSVQHNTRTLSNIRTLTSPLLGIAAGTLCLESTLGFLFYLAGTLFVSALVYAGPAQRKPGRYFGATSAQAGGEARGWTFALEVLLGGVGIEGVMGFVMAWTLAYNLVGT